MNGGMFVLHDDGKLEEMTERPYDSEALLQELLAKYPNLIAGDQVDDEAPRRWLLISREMAVPCKEEGGGRWSLDHLFLDQDAIPTLIEVKRSSDTRIRREVVGQMLDYAANAVVYWPVEAIRSRFEKTCDQEGKEPVSVLAEYLGPGADAESFWQTVKTNLQAGRVRLVFISDDIPSELRRIVEFLNGQMDPAEVLAIEIKQYIGQGKLKTLVPRLIGQTAVAQQRKSPSSARQEKTDEATFLTEMQNRRGTSECSIARRLIGWSKGLNLGQNFNKYPQSASFIPILKTETGQRYPVSVATDGDLCIQMRWLRESAPFNDEAKRQELWQKLNDIPGIQVPWDRMTGMPTIPLNSLSDGTILGSVLEVLTWVVRQLRAEMP